MHRWIALLLLLVLTAPAAAQPMLRLPPRPASRDPGKLTEAWDHPPPLESFDYGPRQRDTVGLSVGGPDGQPFITHTFPDLPACEWARALALKRPDSPAYACVPLAR